MKPTSLLVIAIFLISCQRNKVTTNTPPLSDSTVLITENIIDSTEINEEPVLKGTTVLTGSAKNRTAQWVHGLYLQDIRSSPCRISGEKVPPTEITSVSNPDDSTLIITANVFANCAS